MLNSWGYNIRPNYAFLAVFAVPKKTKGPILRIGNQVLVKNAGVRGSCKLADQWHKDHYIVIDQPNDDIPIYKDKREGAR